MTVGEAIKDMRKQRGLSLNALSAMCGVSRATVSRWETGVIKNILPTHIHMISLALGMDADRMSDLMDNGDVAYAYRRADVRTKRAVRILLNLDE